MGDATGDVDDGGTERTRSEERGARNEEEEEEEWSGARREGLDSWEKGWKGWKGGRVEAGIWKPSRQQQRSRKSRWQTGRMAKRVAW